MTRHISSLAIICLAIFVLAACSSNHMKKVVIMANGKMTMDESKQKIKLDPGNTHTEQEIEFNSGDKITLNIESPDGVKTFDLAEDGIYLLNLKVDTLVGGIVNYSAAERTTAISGEQLERMIDSTRQLIEGKNTSDEKKTYFIIPWNIKKISTNASVKIIGPYKGIPYKVEVDDSGKATEIYKFFTNKQKRETLNDLLKRFGPGTPPDAGQ
ncbi:MAG TPA: hypothetical protein VGD17_05885 [Chitinophagaceae bacterium]